MINFDCLTVECVAKRGKQLILDKPQFQIKIILLFKNLIFGLKSICCVHEVLITIVLFSIEVSKFGVLIQTKKTRLFTEYYLEYHHTVLNNRYYG